MFFYRGVYRKMLGYQKNDDFHEIFDIENLGMVVSKMFLFFCPYYIGEMIQFDSYLFKWVGSTTNSKWLFKQNIHLKLLLCGSRWQWIYLDLGFGP